MLTETWRPPGIFREAHALMDVRLTVGSVAHGGHCVARLDGRAVFVRHALPGEVVDAQVIEGGDDARYWRADAVRILEASSDRVPSAWPEAGPGGVGGGELAHVALPAQREWKLAVLRESFERFAHREFTGTVEAAPGDDALGGLRYRTRVSAVADSAGRPAMHVYRSSEMRALSAMPLALSQAERALLETRAEPGERISVTVAADGDPVVVVGEGRSPLVRETVASATGEIYFQVEAAGFWQVHREAPRVLVDAVMGQLGDAESVLDLYAGSGLLGAAIARSGRRVTLVESDSRAAATAAKNVKAWKAEVIRSDVRRSLLGTDLEAADAIVLDPPRAGAGAKTIEAIAARAPRRIVYVACDPVALARDVALLDERGYEPTNMSAHDLFPMTHHVETIATFEQR